jgi:hypothetical protein
MTNRPIPKSSNMIILALIVVTVAGCGKSPYESGWETVLFSWEGARM